MSLNQSQFNHFHLHRPTTIFFLLLCCFCQSALAADVSDKAFKTPRALIQKPVSNKADAIALLSSPTFKTQLITLAEVVNKSAMTSMKNNEKIALNSILGLHDNSISLINKNRHPSNFHHYHTYAVASRLMSSSNDLLSTHISDTLINNLANASDESLHKISSTMGWSLSMGQDYMLDLFKYYQKNETMSSKQMINLIANYQLYKVYEAILPLAKPVIVTEQNKRYLINANVLIKTPDGATISAIVVRKKGDSKKRPVAFQFSIYADEAWQTKQAIHAAAHGYIGVVANTRGKAQSPDEIVPWEHDGADANAVIDWTTKQPWSDGRVAMYGGSYLGFTQWAAAKYHHPALKTIVPYEAAHPVVGLPIENNIFITPNYQWAFHVTNNKTMDHSVYADWEHWQKTYDELFTSGRSFREIDQIEGTPNPWFQKWLNHPSYDNFYQSMLPYQDEYAQINIPILSITGYFGASISALHFFNNHHKYNKNANHALLIGPYSHGTAQGIPRAYHSNYKLDSVALEKDTQEITFQWFDHVLFDQPKPELIKDDVNFQLMGSNSWQHVSSLKKLNEKNTTFHLGNTKDNNDQYLLSTAVASAQDHIKQAIDLTDRKTQFNLKPRQVIQQEFKPEHGLVFMTEAMTEAHQLAGSITGHFNLAINKKDVDIGYNFYELKANGEAFHLAYYISRASYAQDMSHRKLLTPNKKTKVPIINGKMTAKLIEKGSRLVLVLNVNKNSGAQVNLGSGKDVSDETFADAGEPLEIKWFSDSEINIPLQKWITE